MPGMQSELQTSSRHGHEEVGSKDALRTAEESASENLRTPAIRKDEENTDSTQTSEDNAVVAPATLSNSSGTLLPTNEIVLPEGSDTPPGSDAEIRAKTVSSLPATQRKNVENRNGKPTKNNLNAARRNKKKLNLDKNIAKVKLKKTTHMLAYTCKDMCGRKHDVKELRDRRYRGVMKGIKFMQHFFRKNQYKALYAIGDDAPSIFFEMWYTSADSRVRSISKSLAIEFTEKLENAFEEKKRHKTSFRSHVYCCESKNGVGLRCSPEDGVKFIVIRTLEMLTLFEVSKDGLDSVKRVLGCCF